MASIQVLESLRLLRAKFTRVPFSMDRSMGKESGEIQRETAMRENTPTIKSMALESIVGKMGKFSRDNLKMESK